MPILAIRKLADKSSGQRSINPVTGTPEPWPLAGVQIEGDLPVATTVPTTFVETGVAEGWLTVEGERLVHRPGGPASAPWRITHTFRHADTLTIHCVQGDVRYRITHQPDKYADPGDDNTPVTSEVYADGATRVDWFYGLELVVA